MDTDLMILIAAVLAWTYVAFRVGRLFERRRHRVALSIEPPTTRQFLYLAHLAEDMDVGMPPVRTRVEAAAAIDDLIEERRQREEQK